MDIDTTELRSSPPAAVVPSPVQKRLEEWAPPSASALRSAEKAEKALSRKHASLSSKVATLAKNNERASDVAAQQRIKLGVLTNQQRAALEAKESKAETLRRGLLAKQVQEAAAHVAHAQQVAEAVKAEELEALEEKKRSAAARDEAAQRRAEESLAAKAEKAGEEYVKAETLSSAKKEALEEMRRTVEAKHELAGARMATLAEAKLSKLSALTEHAKQVRKTKNTTVGRGTRAAEAKKAATLSPVHFDMGIKAPGVGAEASPARLRFEARLEARTTAAAAKTSLSSSSSAAAGGGELACSKAQTAAKAANLRVESVAEAQREVLAAAAAELEARVSAKQVAAEERRAFILTEQVGKAGAHFEKVQSVREAQKSVEDAALLEKESALQASLETAEQRRASLAQARDAKREAELLKLQVSHAERARARESELETKRAELAHSMAAAELKRAENLDAVTKNAAAFSSPWSPLRSELSPSKNSPDKTLLSAAADCSVHGIEVAEAIEEAAGPSPRKDIKAFVRAVPATPPPTGAGAGAAAAPPRSSPMVVPACIAAVSAVCALGAAYFAQQAQAM